ncbi:sulfotransferase family protein [Allohahella marinimesophila]|uniref:Sulfotransferase n=1 Tax=Allohahella marinimesophila TaxID=1054972 RepID=A0ABP7PZM3_9GAMM
MKHPLKPRLDDKRLKRSKKFWLHRLTAPFRALPEFLIIGEMKSGTSSLFYYLQRHPMIASPLRKEIHFFNIGHRKGLGWYRAHFPLRKNLTEHQITGEGCPEYLFAPGAAERIQRTIPNARLIVLLRDPVQRAISHYHHEIKMGREYLPLFDALTAEEERINDSDMASPEGLETYLHASYKLRGRYADHLSRLFTIFDRKQVLILGNNELLRDPEAVTNKVYEFLGLERMTGDIDFPKKNVGNREPVPSEVISYLEEYFEPHNQTLFTLLGKKIDW